MQNGFYINQAFGQNCRKRPNVTPQTPQNADKQRDCAGCNVGKNVAPYVAPTSYPQRHRATRYLSRVLTAASKGMPYTMAEREFCLVSQHYSHPTSQAGLHDTSLDAPRLFCYFSHYPTVPSPPPRHTLPDNASQNQPPVRNPYGNNWLMSRGFFPHFQCIFYFPF